MVQFSSSGVVHYSTGVDTIAAQGIHVVDSTIAGFFSLFGF